MTVDALSDQYINQAVTLTGSQVISSKALIEMIFEIANIKPNIKFKNIDLKNTKHYTKTPYRYTPKKSKKISPNEYIDFGQGLLEVIEAAYKKKIKINFAAFKLFKNIILQYEYHKKTT